MKRFFISICCIMYMVAFGFADTEPGGSGKKVVVDVGNQPSKVTVVVDFDEAGGGNGENVIAGQPVKTKRKVRAFSLHTGLSLSGLAATNIVSSSDFFKKTAVIDLTKLSKNMIRSGAHLNGFVDIDHFFQFTVMEAHTVKFNTTLFANGWVNLSEKFIKILAKGNGGALNGDFGIRSSVESYIDTGVFYQLKKPNYGFSARLAYFVPLVYMDDLKLDAKFTGGRKVSLNAKASMYINPALSDVLNKKKFSTSRALSNGGFDLSLNGNYAPAPWVDILFGLSYLPLAPAFMDNGISLQAKYEG